MSLIQQAPSHQQKQKQAQYGLRETYNPLFLLKVDFYRLWSDHTIIHILPKEITPIQK